MALFRSGKASLALLAIGLGLGVGQACVLNPQPEDPFVRESGEPDAGTGARSGTGGASTGGSAAGGSVIIVSGGLTASGGSMASGGVPSGAAGAAAGGGMDSAAGAPAWDVEGECVAPGGEPLIDDATDCDGEIALADGRRGLWFAYDSNPELPGNQQPAAGTVFTLGEDTARGCVVSVVGGDFPNDAASGFGFAGVGIEFLVQPGFPCVGGYDASAYAGIGLFARGSGSLRLLVETADTASSGGRPQGYAAIVPLTATWTRIEVAWTDLRLLEPVSGAPDTLDPRRIVTLRFEPVDPAAYEFWLDDLEFLGPPPGAGGTSGVGGTSGAGGTSGVGGATATPPAGAAGAGRAGSAGAVAVL